MRRIHIRCVVDTGSTYREPIAIVIELNCVSKPNIYNLCDIISWDIIQYPVVPSRYRMVISPLYVYIH